MEFQLQVTLNMVNYLVDFSLRNLNILVLTGESDAAFKRFLFMLRFMRWRVSF